MREMDFVYSLQAHRAHAAHGAEQHWDGVVRSQLQRWHAARHTAPCALAARRERHVRSEMAQRGEHAEDARDLAHVLEDVVVKLEPSKPGEARELCAQRCTLTRGQSRPVDVADLKLRSLSETLELHGLGEVG